MCTRQYLTNNECNSFMSLVLLRRTPERERVLLEYKITVCHSKYLRTNIYRPPTFSKKQQPFCKALHLHYELLHTYHSEVQSE